MLGGDGMLLFRIRVPEREFCFSRRDYAFNHSRKMLTNSQAVFRCIYAQCDTIQFGAALHHVITQCADSGASLLLHPLQITHNEELRRREEEYAAGSFKLEGSGSAAGYPTESNSGYPTQSAATVVTFPTTNLMTVTGLPDPSTSIPVATQPIVYTGGNSPKYPSFGWVLLGIISALSILI